MGVKELKKAGTEFLFRWMLTRMRPAIVEALRAWLEKYSDDQIRQMMARGEMPPMPADLFIQATGYADFADSFTLEELLEEYLGPARPSIIAMITEMPDVTPGYLVKLHGYLLDRIKHPEQAQVTASEKAPPQTVTCDQCQKSFPFTDGLTACPFCNAPAN